MTVNNQLREFITTNYYIPPETRLESVASLLASGILDSTGVLELVTFVESRFGVSVADDELVPANFDSLHALTAFVERKVRAP